MQAPRSSGPLGGGSGVLLHGHLSAQYSVLKCMSWYVLLEDFLFRRTDRHKPGFRDAHLGNERACLLMLARWCALSCGTRDDHEPGHREHASGRVHPNRG